MFWNMDSTPRIHYRGVNFSLSKWINEAKLVYNYWKVHESLEEDNSIIWYIQWFDWFDIFNLSFLYGVDCSMGVDNSENVFILNSNLLQSLYFKKISLPITTHIEKFFTKALILNLIDAKIIQIAKNREKNNNNN